MCLLHWLLDLDFDLFKLISFSLANCNESISRRGKYLLLEGHAHFHITYSSSLLHDLFKNLYCVLRKQLSLKGRKKKSSLLVLCPLVLGCFHLETFCQILPRTKLQYFILVYDLWILPKSLAQQYFFFLLHTADFSLTLSFLSPQIIFNNPAFQVLWTFLPLLLNINYFFL